MNLEAFERGALSSAAVEVLGQLFAYGPTWDGNVVSKNGRGELVRAGLAWHENGWCSLTPEGVRVAVEWDIAAVKRHGNPGWIKKRRDS